ncbi:MAG: polysaccharide deacetylase family protein [Myxococcales bacterium]|nr:polysaccharide deacetylase family protein [Myxococcales bacterium]
MSAIVTRTGRLVLYALALTGGALTAHLTAPGAINAVARATDVRAAASEPLVVGRRDSTAPLPELELPTPNIVAGQPDTFGRAFKGGKIIGGGTQHRLILFSFDDGPDRRHTPLLLDRLDAEGIRGVFFLTAARLAGRNLMERQQIAIAREIAARGHTIASHTLDHEQLPLLDDAAVRAQIVGAERVFERVFGRRPWLMRPPGGARSARVDRLIAERGYTTILWNLGAGDFQVRSAQEVVETWKKVFERREEQFGERGGIILLHDTHAWSVDAFQMIVAELWRRNCELLVQGDELYDIVNDPALFFEPRADAPATAFARPATLPPELLAQRQAAVRREAERRCVEM